MDIVTSSFGLTKIVTLSPSIVIINKSTVCFVANPFIFESNFLLIQIEIEVVETVSDKEQDKWGPANPEQVKTEFFRLNRINKLIIDNSILAT